MHKEVFCRDLDAISRKQGMKGGSVLAHVTDWNDDADEESAPKREQKSVDLFRTAFNLAGGCGVIVFDAFDKFAAIFTFSGGIDNNSDICWRFDGHAFGGTGDLSFVIPQKCSG
jgi:hypothetical protein